MECTHKIYARKKSAIHIHNHVCNEKRPYLQLQDQKPANNRTDVTEIIGTNGVHPTINGYYQIADAVYRSLYNDFKI